MDEKECGPACSTIVLAHCQKDSNREYCINIGRTLIQKNDINYKIKLCDVSDVIGHLEILTPSELAINARELMLQAPYITSSSKTIEEMTGIENPFSVDGIVFRNNFDIHQGSIIYIFRGKLDIKNLRYDVDKLEVRRLQMETFERFEVQTVLYGEKIQISNKQGTLIDLEIYPFIYMYIPYFLAKTLKEHFGAQTCVDVDVIGMISLTENYLCFRKEKGRFGDYREFREFLYDKFNGNALKVEKDQITDNLIKNYLQDSKKYYDKLKKTADIPLESTDPLSLSRVIFEEKFDFGIRPIALWLV